MTDTRCPSCNVLLDLPKFATGTCEWCGQSLPHEMVTHARERVASRKEARRRIDDSHAPPADTGNQPARLPGWLWYSGIGVVLVLAVFLGVSALPNGPADLTRPLIAVPAALAVAITLTLVYRMLARHRSSARP